MSAAPRLLKNGAEMTDALPRLDAGSSPPEFQKSSETDGMSPRSPGGANPPALQFERADWVLFRTVEGLQQKAGVPASRLRRLVMKELADNALDNGGDVKVGFLGDGRLFVEDNGPGLDGTPDEIARMFSVNRPMVSSKLLRLPTRGALGNGLRVVAGAVLASEGSLVIVTRNQRIVLRPERDGSTTVVEVTPADFPAGTRIEIGFGPAMPADPYPLQWASRAKALARTGKGYMGKSSPWWYDITQFHELLFASGPLPVRDLVAALDGCSGATAGKIVADAGLARARCEDVTRQQAALLLDAAQRRARPVKPERLGEVGPDAFPGAAYACERGVATFGSSEPKAAIPFVVEAWVSNKPVEPSGLDTFVNRTPITGDVRVYRSSVDKKNLYVHGCGLGFHATAPKGAYSISLNVTSPYIPITSDGKSPDLGAFARAIVPAIEKAVRRARRDQGGGERERNIKDVVLAHLDEAIAAASGDGKFRFNERQVLYQLRPIVMRETDKELTVGNFKKIITAYEAEVGEIELMYREPRGSVYHPHGGDEMALGTLSVEAYERPTWTFNKLVYIEKEGFAEALKAVRWAERHDCAVMSSKGYTTRAAKDLVDKLAAHDEPVTIFCVHDADAPGTMIHQTFQQATKARGARLVEIVNLGLEPWEALDMDLQVEDLPEPDQRRPVADYVSQRPDGEHWVEWLQTHRVELNALTTPAFIRWLDDKMAAHGTGKLIPPQEVVKAEFERRLEGKVRAAITERILREAGIDALVAAALDEIEHPDGDALVEGIKGMFDHSPDSEWRKYVEQIAVISTR